MSAVPPKRRLSHPRRRSDAAPCEALQGEAGLFLGAMMLPQIAIWQETATRKRARRDPLPHLRCRADRAASKGRERDDEAGRLYTQRAGIHCGKSGTPTSGIFQLLVCPPIISLISLKGPEMGVQLHAFFAYPSVPVIADLAKAASVQLGSSNIALHLWEENDITGRPLIEPILDNIDSASFIIADITYLNFNVTFE